MSEKAAAAGPSNLIHFSPRAYVASVWHDITTSLRGVARDRAALVAIIILILPWWSLIFLRDNVDWLWTFGEVAALIFAFWWLSRSGGMPAPKVKYPRAESLFAFGLTATWILWRIGICGKDLPFLPANFVCYQNWEFEVLPKICLLVLIPVFVLFLLGYRWNDQGLGLSARAWWVSSLALIGVVVYGVAIHFNAVPAFGQRSVEFFFGAGLPEEFLFRALLLTRLEAWWRNAGWALLGSSIIFGLTHLPIDYLVFSSNNMREAWITLLTFQMGMGGVFAFGYQRTRNLWPLAVLHSFIDALHF